VISPERLDHFMARANAAYYAMQNPFADFTTGPELTPVFGELLGAWSRVVWALIGAPENIMLAEAGPGRGTLMASALRAWPAPPAIHLIETSPRLRAEQASRIPNAIWHDALASIPAGPLILLANEFLDALPIRQLVRGATGWLERHVQNGAFIDLPAAEFHPGDPPGTVREINQSARDFIRALAARNAVALFIDYGPAASAPGASLQAISNGKYADPLAAPGTADLTAHVDFAALAAAALAAGAQVHGPIKQNAFLTALGLHQRTAALAAKHPDQAQNLKQAALRLTAPEAMGSLFKVLAICPKDLPALPGFES
jgi:NADH dehydrogenase [ubiquinone] 1 alpha subcomplex assembly factor 7